MTPPLPEAGLAGLEKELKLLLLAAVGAGEDAGKPKGSVDPKAFEAGAAAEEVAQGSEPQEDPKGSAEATGAAEEVANGSEDPAGLEKGSAKELKTLAAGWGD